MKVDTSLGSVRVKIKRLEGSIVAISPEYEECRKVALQKNVPLIQVYQEVQNQIKNFL